MYILTTLLVLLDGLPEIDGEHLYVFTRYLAEIIANGDPESIWLELMPDSIQDALYEVGLWLTYALGW